MSAKEIGQRSKMHKTKISRAVARLEERRFLTRQASEEDRRLEYLQLTQQGQAAYRELLEVAERYDSQLTAALTPEEVVGLRALLRKLAGMG
jgi:DNA-binding MarR family transcriptional regulator